MKVCDRCKKELVTGNEIKLVGNKFELCLDCAGLLSDHIKNYNPKKKTMGDRIGDFFQ